MVTLSIAARQRRMLTRAMITCRGTSIATRTLGVTPSRGEMPAIAYVAVTDPYAGHQHRYTLWAIPLGTSVPNAAAIIGRELDLRTARAVVRQALRIAG